jgi:hypothetical protein
MAVPIHDWPVENESLALANAFALSCPPCASLQRLSMVQEDAATAAGTFARRDGWYADRRVIVLRGVLQIHSPYQHNAHYRAIVYHLTVSGFDRLWI